MSGALDSLGTKAKDLIDKFGKDLLYLDLGDLVYDPTTGDITEPSETNRAFVGVVAKVKDSLVDGEVFKKGDFMVIMGADGLSWEPEEGRQVVLGTTAATDNRYTIVSIDPVYTGNEIGVYKLHVRK